MRGSREWRTLVSAEDDLPFSCLSVIMTMANVPSHNDDADDANAPIVTDRVTALLPRLSPSAAGGTSTQGVSPCQELTAGLIIYLNTKIDTDG